MSSPEPSGDDSEPDDTDASTPESTGEVSIPGEDVGDTEAAEESVEEEKQYVEGKKKGREEGRNEGFYKGLDRGRIELIIAKLAGLHQDRRERKRYARRVFWLLAFWLAGILGIVFISGLSWKASTLQLSLSGYEFIWLYFPLLVSGILLYLLKHYNLEGTNKDSPDSDEESNSGTEEGEVLSPSDYDNSLSTYSRLFREAAENPESGKGEVERVVGAVLIFCILTAPFLTWYFSITEWDIQVASFNLPASVLNTLLATTTVNLVGLFLVVANYLFQNENKSGIDSLIEEIKKVTPNEVGN